MNNFTMIKPLMLGLMFCLFGILGYGQVTIASQSFEAVGDTWTFTTNPAPYNTEDALGDNGTVNGNEDIWDDIAGFVDDIDVASDGTVFWGMQDLDNTNGGGSFAHTLTFSQNITLFESVVISFDYNVIGFDGGDDLFYELVYDGVGQGDVLLIEGANNGGGLSSAGWETETVNIPNTVDVVGLILKATQNGATDYAGWDNVIISGAVILPVTVSSFSGYTEYEKTHLTFTTATEESNSHFLIQRSTDEGKTFTTIGQLAGQGDSNQPTDYKLVDTKPATGMNYYRLQQFDFDGTNEFFGPVAVRFGDVAAETPSVWPVPTRDRLQVELPTSDAAWQLNVFDLNGKLMLSQTVEEKSTLTTLSVQQFPAGSYFLRWTNGQRSGQERFMKL